MSFVRLAFAAGLAVFAMSSIATTVGGDADAAGQSEAFSELLTSTAAGDLRPPPKPELDSFEGIDAVDSIELGVTKATDLATGTRSVPVRAIPVRIGPQDTVILIRKDAVPVPKEEADALFEVETTVASGKTVALLTGQGINSLIVGHSLRGFARGGWWTEYYAPDGTIRGQWRGNRYLAKWSVEGKKMCFHYAERSTYCLMYSVVGDQVFFYQPDGTGGRKAFKLLAGNASGL